MAQDCLQVTSTAHFNSSLTSLCNILAFFPSVRLVRRRRLVCAMLCCRPSENLHRRQAMTLFLPPFSLIQMICSFFSIVRLLTNWQWLYPRLHATMFLNFGDTSSLPSLHTTFNKIRNRLNTSSLFFLFLCVPGRSSCPHCSRRSSHQMPWNSGDR